jgi:hypothetical protein
LSNAGREINALLQRQDGGAASGGNSGKGAKGGTKAFKASDMDAFTDGEDRVDRRRLTLLGFMGNPIHTRLTLHHSYALDVTPLICA